MRDIVSDKLDESAVGLAHFHHSEPILPNSVAIAVAALARTAFERG